MNYNPPSFRKPQQFDGSLDGIFEQYQAMKAAKEQAGRQDFADTVQYGTPLRGLTPEQMQRGAAGPTQIPAQPAYEPNNMVELARPAQPAREQFDNDPHVAAIQRFIQNKKSAASMASQEQALGMDKTRSEIAENEAQAGKFKTEAEMAGANRGLKAESELRGELQTLSKPFVQVRDAMGRIEASANKPTAAGDLALIFNYMKVLDPGSTVREGEFATAQNSAGIPDRIVAQYNKVKSGERLAPEQRADFLERARELYKSQLSIQKQQEEQYRGLSGRLGARPENVILDQGLPAPEEIQTRTLKDGSKVRVKSNGKGGWVEVP